LIALFLQLAGFSKVWDLSFVLLLCLSLSVVAPVGLGVVLCRCVFVVGCVVSPCFVELWRLEEARVSLEAVFL
jgi:hypothetical protein